MTTFLYAFQMPDGQMLEIEARNALEAHRKAGQQATLKNWKMKR